MIDHEARIINTLADIPSLKYVGDAWPGDEADFPRIIVELASDRAADHKDDQAYLVELVYYLRIFGADKATMRTVLAEADERMATIGYKRTFRHEQNDANVKLWTTRYLTTVYAKED